jgi:hypothetical protein
MNNALYGAGGNDSYTFGSAGLTSGIASYCDAGSEGTDSIVIDDSADTVGRSFHINSGFINAVPNDTLFASAGGNAYGLVFPEVTGSITIKLGSGADTINFAPVPVGQGIYAIQANNPTSGTGDSLNLAFAGASNPVFTPSGVGAGTYTFSNKATFSYTGIESKNIDSVAPSFLLGRYNYDAINGSSIDLQYSEDVSPGLYNTHYTVANLTTGGPSFDFTYSYDAATNTVHYTFPAQPGGVLPNGSYFTSAARVTDAFGNAMVGSAQFNFIWTGGTAGADTFHLALDGAATNVDVFENNEAAPAFTAALGTLGTIFVAGGDDDDTTIVDLSNGNPIPAGGMTFDGQGGNNSFGGFGSSSNDNATFNPNFVSLNSRSVNLANVTGLSFDGNGGADTLNVQFGTVHLPSAQHFASLTIKNNGLVVADPGGGNTLVIDLLTLVGTGSLDVTDNALIFTNSTVPAVQALLATGFNLGAWNGTGINSSTAAADPVGNTALGFADNAVLQLATFGGVPGLIGTEVLVKYTYYGDSDLNGKVTLDDFSLFLEGYQNVGTTWLTGDYDFNGSVDLNDFSTFLGGYQNQGPQL